MQISWLRAEKPRQLTCTKEGTERCVSFGLYRLATGRAPPAEAKKRTEGRPFYRKWWFWAAVAAAAVGGGAAGTAVYVANQPARTDVDIVSRP